MDYGLDSVKQRSSQYRLRKGSGEVGAAEYLRHYTRIVIPQIESKIEERLLFRFMRGIKNSAERKEVFDAYLMRRHNLTHVKEEDNSLDEGRGDESSIRTPEELEKIRNADMKEIIQTVHGDGLSHHTYQDIGRYTIFPHNHYKRMFPTKAFGRIETQEYEISKTFGIMTREEGLRLTNELSRLTLPSERSINYGEIATTYTNAQTKQDIVQDEHNHCAVQQDFALSLIDYIENSGDERNDLRKFFIHPGVFDGIVSMLVREMHKKPMRPHLCDANARKLLIAQLVGKIREGLGVKEIRTFAEICEAMPLINL